jgi:uncharacterized membrane protein (DUF485 family)
MTPMNPDREAELAALAARRWRVALALTVTMIVTYFGFLYLVAYDKPRAAAPVFAEPRSMLPTLETTKTQDLSWGIVLGALVIVVAWVVTAVYVRWANTHYDAALAALRSSMREPREGDL